MDDLTEVQVDLIRNSLYLDAAVYLLELNSLTFCEYILFKSFYGRKTLVKKYKIYHYKQGILSEGEG
jgi:hypothetical protein